VEETGLSKLQEIGRQFIFPFLNRLALLYIHTRFDSKSVTIHVHHNLSSASLHLSLTTASCQNSEIHSLAIIRPKQLIRILSLAMPKRSPDRGRAPTGCGFLIFIAEKGRRE
jgi:hypothetical protein